VTLLCAAGPTPCRQYIKKERGEEEEYKEKEPRRFNRSYVRYTGGKAFNPQRKLKQRCAIRNKGVYCTYATWSKGALVRNNGHSLQWGRPSARLFASICNTSEHHHNN
jgi:hypothetical protein